ncbi:hypothetical protein CGLO_16253 [Colletotrichum gloeosporioides Cg-14]|uniref:Uncharacterized protein n=1 Tax=Colletotrichum gloeosporioides (strain Cg-14) TaxID=1237896 RepID=T0L9T1_COLGC|nr:hypothetical protein CGLO_16253 [Colletotrichum gloeosporioides Cg-14]
MAVCRVTAGIQPYLVTVTEKEINSPQVPSFGGDSLRNNDIHYPVGKHHGNRNATQQQMLRFGSLLSL